MNPKRSKPRTMSISELYLARAKLFEMVGDYDKAYRDLKHAEIKSRGDSKKTFLFTRLEMGNLDYLKGQFMASVRRFDRLEASIKRLDSKDLTFLFWRYRGNLFRVKGDYKTALFCYRKLMRHLAGKDAAEKKAIVYNLIGLAYNGMGDYPLAARYIKRAYRYYFKIGNIPGQGNTLGNIGLTYTFWNKSDQAVTFFQKAITLLGQAQVKNLIATPMMNWGTALFNLKQYDAALDKWKEALHVNQSLGDIASVAMIHNNIGYLYMEKGELEKSLEQLHLSLKIKLKLNLKGYLSSTYNCFARVHIKMHEKTGSDESYEQAKNYAGLALSIARSLHNKREMLSAEDIFKTLKKFRGKK
jgi:tetratricopeptide (TPR) repeat protein